MALPLLDAMAPAHRPGGGRQEDRSDADGFRLCAQRHAHARLDARGRGRRFRAALHSWNRSSRVKDQLLVLSGLAQDHGRANGDGPGDHARALSSFLTGQQARKTHGADIKVGVSVDQVAARKVGQRTRFPSLELGCDRGSQAGNCDSGYSCSYSTNISWRTDTTPQAKEIDPEAGLRAAVLRRRRRSRGALEARPLSARAFSTSCSRMPVNLQSKLGTKDRRKLDEYLSSVRELEAANQLGRPQSGRAGARLSGAHRHSGRLRRAYPADVRPDGAGVPGRPDARLDVRRGQRRQQSRLSVHRRAGRPPRSVAPRRQSRKAGQDSQDQPLPRDAVRLLPREAARHLPKASERCWTTR